MMLYAIKHHCLHKECYSFAFYFKSKTYSLQMKQFWRKHGHVIVNFKDNIVWSVKQGSNETNTRQYTINNAKKL